MVRGTWGPAHAGRPGKGLAVMTAQRGLPWPLVLLGGLVGGLAWGVVARVWMRFISTNPEFTWNGTLFIVIGFGIAGLAQSGAYLARRAGLSRPRLTVVRVITFAGLLPLGVAAGGQVFPTVVLAPLALTHTAWPRWTRLVVGVLALVPLATVGSSLFDDLSPPRATVGFLWFLGIYAVIVWAAGFTLAPQPDGWRAPIAVRAVGVAVLALGVVLAAFLAGGLQG